MKSSRLVIAGLFASVALGMGCATTGAQSDPDANVPNAGVGPFRKLTTDEIRGIAPFVLDDARALYREPAVLRDATGPGTQLYAVARVGDEDVIVRTRANDERSFFGSSTQFGAHPAVVLAPDAPWERALSGPTLVRFGGELLLYYAGDDGIGMARSADGVVFAKVAGPLLGRDVASGTWETSSPRAPSVYVAEDGRSLHMFYAAGAAIGEAESTDGVVWRRLGAGPVLVPSGPASSAPNDEPPFDTSRVGDPCVVTRRTPAGRFHVRVLYTGTDAVGATAIGFAARYGDVGTLERQRVPVYSVSQHEAAPALLEIGPRSYLYVEQQRKGGNTTYSAIAAAIAPATVVLPEPGDFPEGP